MSDAGIGVEDRHDRFGILAEDIHLAAGCSSMFDYCVRVLGYDEAAAYNRIFAARLGRRFPLVLEMIADGRLHLTGARLLGPHLTEDGHTGSCSRPPRA